MEGLGICKAERQSQTSEQMEQLDKCVSALSESVIALEGRLSKALRISPKSPNDENKAVPDDELVPLAGLIRQLRHRISGMSEDVRNILDRLEL